MALAPITGTNLTGLDVAIAVAGAAVVIGVLVTAVVLRDSVVVMVMVMVVSPMGNGTRRQHRGGTEREQCKSCDQQAANPVNEHRDVLFSRYNSAREVPNVAGDHFDGVCALCATYPQDVQRAQSFLAREC
jgi:hypothetical protein